MEWMLAKTLPTPKCPPFKDPWNICKTTACCSISKLGLLSASTQSPFVDCGQFVDEQREWTLVKLERERILMKFRTIFFVECEEPFLTITDADAWASIFWKEALA
uniref:Uncharacterized protein n=1 Tax=Romanomermis culicivorax TaxID=13658 RepID=A0A915K5F3_ROMCU